jgi:hypothetical protein
MWDEVVRLGLLSWRSRSVKNPECCWSRDVFWSSDVGLDQAKKEVVERHVSSPGLAGVVPEVVSVSVPALRTKTELIKDGGR